MREEVSLADREMNESGQGLNNKVNGKSLLRVSQEETYLGVVKNWDQKVAYCCT